MHQKQNINKVSNNRLIQTTHRDKNWEDNKELLWSIVSDIIKETQLEFYKKEIINEFNILLDNYYHKRYSYAGFIEMNKEFLDNFHKFIEYIENYKRQHEAKKRSNQFPINENSSHIINNRQLMQNNKLQIDGKQQNKINNFNTNTNLDHTIEQLKLQRMELTQKKFNDLKVNLNTYINKPSPKEINFTDNLEENNQEIEDLLKKELEKRRLDMIQFKMQNPPPLNIEQNISNNNTNNTNNTNTKNNNDAGSILKKKVKFNLENNITNIIDNKINKDNEDNDNINIDVQEIENNAIENSKIPLFFKKLKKKEVELNIENTNDKQQPIILKSIDNNTDNNTNNNTNNSNVKTKIKTKTKTKTAWNICSDLKDNNIILDIDKNTDTILLEKIFIPNKKLYNYISELDLSTDIDSTEYNILKIKISINKEKLNDNTIEDNIIEEYNSMSTDCIKKNQNITYIEYELTQPIEINKHSILSIYDTNNNPINLYNIIQIDDFIEHYNINDKDNNKDNNLTSLVLINRENNANNANISKDDIIFINNNKYDVICKAFITENSNTQDSNIENKNKNIISNNKYNIININQSNYNGLILKKNINLIHYGLDNTDNTDNTDNNTDNPEILKIYKKVLLYYKYTE
jgi:hypothetical protein